MDFTKSDYDLINKEFEELRLAALKRCASQEEYDGVADVQGNRILSIP